MTLIFITKHPIWSEALFWGLVAGSSLLIGAFLGYYLNLSQKILGSVMAFGSGVLILAISFELMDKAYTEGGFIAVSGGFIFGSVIYSLGDGFISNNEVVLKKQSNIIEQPESVTDQNGLQLALGALIDGIPESVAIGISLTQGGTVGKVAVIAIFISNIPEGLSSTAGMKKAGRSKLFIFSLWFVLIGLSALASWSGYVLFSDYSEAFKSTILAFAAGGMLSMVASTMIPEAYEKTHAYTGILTVFGFLTSFILSKLV